MTKAGKRIIEGAKEALAIAKGDQPAARIWHQGHAYVPEGNVRAAVDTIKRHLDTEWISEGCESEHAFGCASCQAISLKRSLDSLLVWEEPDPACSGGLAP